MGLLSGKTIILGITGGIASYKACEIVRKLKQADATVHVIMTDAAREFITPLTLQTLSGNMVHSNLFNLTEESHISHIQLADLADLLLIAPATANSLAKIALGIADNLLTTVCLATQATLMIAPAMNVNMWENPQTQTHLKKLKSKNAIVIEPSSGELACGWEGQGRLADPQHIFEKVLEFFKASPILQNKKILINAGPTREYIDPVRFLSNPSTGKMGYALAEAAQSLGAQVTLISGPSSLTAPANVNFISVTSAKEMLVACENEFKNCDWFIATAAVGDYQVEKVEKNKIKKKSKQLELKLIRTNDILATLAAKKSKHQKVIGFAAETNNIIQYAEQKLKEKNLDAVIANEISKKNPAFANDRNSVELIFKKEKFHFKQQAKTELAKKILLQLFKTLET